jgi:hypothetical protein
LIVVPHARAAILSGRSSLLNSLVAYWKLEDLSDSAGANTLTNNNTTTFAAGKVGNAANMVRASVQSLSVADNAALSTGNVDYTVAGWVKFTSLQAENPIVAKGTSSTTLEFELYGTLTRIVCEWYVASGGSNVKTVSADNFGAISTGTWYFFAMWHDSTAGTINVSVNAGTPNSAAASGGWDGTAAFALGGRGVVTLDGMLDEVGVWKRLLTNAELTRLYNSGNGITHPF